MSNKMWGGRFGESPDEVMEEINASIAFDRRLAPQDIRGSKAHAEMLQKTGILSASDAQAILAGLDQIGQEIENGEFEFSRSLEDIHMNVEGRLTQLIGEAAGRLHTARSRNDQVAVDFRLWIKDAIASIDRQIAALQRDLAAKAKVYADAVMPGVTHLQPAQPVTFGHHLLAYVEMLARDRGRFQDALHRMNECPLGSAALAGTSFPIDREATATALGFDRPTANSLDSVSDRDFVAEFLAAAAICSMHLSRFADELVLWSTPQFDFIRLSDRFTTGSSIMPQKRNPDAAELIRGKTGRVLGALTGLLTVLKGLPLAYSKDLQEDKEGAFDVFDTLSLCLAAMTGMVRDLTARRKRMAQAAADGFSTATDLADWLVRKLDLPFRRAHHITGAIVGYAERNGLALSQVPIEAMTAIEPGITPEIFDVLTVDQSVRSRTSFGGTAPTNVRQQAEAWLRRLSESGNAFPQSGPAGEGA